MPMFDLTKLFKPGRVKPPAPPGPGSIPDAEDAFDADLAAEPADFPAEPVEPVRTAGKQPRRPARKNAKKGEVPLHPFHPESYVAGVAPVGPRSAPHRPAYLAMQHALHADDIRFIYSVVDGQVFYIGAREAEFTVAGELATPLAVAMPGMPGHAGDGAYVWNTGRGFFAMVLLQNGQLLARAGSEDELLRMAAAREVPVRAVSSENLTPWGKDIALARAKSRKQTTGIAVWGFGLATLFGAAAFPLTVMQSSLHDSIEQTRQGTRDSLNRTASEFSRAQDQPITRQIESVQRLHRVVQSYSKDAWIEYTRLEGDKLVWKIRLPIYTTGQVVESLAPGTRVWEADGVLIATNDPTVLSPASSPSNIRIEKGRATP